MPKGKKIHSLKEWESIYENDVYLKNKFDYDKDNKLLVYLFTIFKGYKDDWDKGVMELYKNVCNGIYGCYDVHKLWYKL